jgi:hypothetical protein
VQLESDKNNSHRAQNKVEYTPPFYPYKIIPQIRRAVETEEPHAFAGKWRMENRELQGEYSNHQTAWKLSPQFAANLL